MTTGGIRTPKAFASHPPVRPFQRNLQQWFLINRGIATSLEQVLLLKFVVRTGFEPVMVFILFPLPPLLWEHQCHLTIFYFSKNFYKDMVTFSSHQILFVNFFVVRRGIEPVFTPCWTRTNTQIFPV